MEINWLIVDGIPCILTYNNNKQIPLFAEITNG